MLNEVTLAMADPIGAVFLVVGVRVLAGWRERPGATRVSHAGGVFGTRLGIEDGVDDVLGAPGWSGGWA